MHHILTLQQCKRRALSRSALRINPGSSTSARHRALGFSCGRLLRELKAHKGRKKMKRNSTTFAASAAALFTFALVAVTAPSARADDYCITNGAQAAHGCGYPTMEACQAASAGIGGMCSPGSSSKSQSSNAFAFEPRQTHSHGALHRGKRRIGH